MSAPFFDKMKRNVDFLIVANLLKALIVLILVEPASRLELLTC